MDPKPLPADLDAAHALIQKQAVALELKDKLIEEQAHSVLELKSDRDKLDEKNIELNLTIEKLLKQLFGRKSERRIDCDGQLHFDLGEEPTPEVISALEEAICDARQIVDDAEEDKKKRRRNRSATGDRKFPEHLPRYERIVDVPEGKREGLTLIGYDEVETLEWVPADLKVRLTKYAKYVHPTDKAQGIVSPERPTGLVEWDRFDASIGVEVVAWKYFYHLPFYRQQDMFGASGWTPSRSTLQNIETAVEFALRPLAEHLQSILKQDPTVGCDDTGVLLITPAAMPDLSDHPRGKRITEVLEKAMTTGKPSIKANFWGYYASRLPVVAFDFTVSRHRDGPDDVLSDFEGNLIGDCWSGFQKIQIRSDSRITFAACWAHARRKIDECRSAFPIQVAKLESLIGNLYDVEDQCKHLTAPEQLSRRQSLSRHVLDQIEAYLSSEAMQSPKVLPKSNLGMAAAYVRRHWEALHRFTEDVSIPLDNNDCEQLMKRVATGRKNWMFKGSVAAGERAANLMTIIGSAIRNNLDVRAYLDDVLRRALSGETDWQSMTPHAWKAEHPESIRQYRDDERRQAADRKKTRRARRRTRKK
ncbi:Transposase IS66 family protein [Rubripirellula lacrimiformis]|uniref:Transposase IS66 family protein n=1 Tax=Rubripirellula lacrimiformis TaxID=1930273 RepID=A0A517N5F6_9BACT|nr:transposase [Rubripirellula lacrimiformis]QDT01760.1 Transposase IS66 family protein [Rubripirellula lacrimiformis]QDT02370.1 Transposase IS66 family protein [Rubripirellula lacrimiformis]QDT04218.1 Transposase IS66 family protein [Rubripirellula lacrimiformis]QDT07026.1 Transposase IS66 family protein [Rubripirellula lacrimiformis]QDT07441.1 Transposase IS66 family protein [Rubripirellula lacrimiformis]